MAEGCGVCGGRPPRCDCSAADVRCHACGGTGTDSDVVAVDPYPIHMPFPCGWCEGTGEAR